MSSLQVSVRLNPSFDEWYGAKTVVQEELQAIGKALERIRISSQLQDAFTGHLFAVHRQWCEACPLAREPGLSGGGQEKEAHTNIPTRAAAAHNPMKQKRTFVSCVSTFTQTTDVNGLQMNAQGEVDDNNDDISETSVPSSMTCRVEDEDSQADVHRTLEKLSPEKVVRTESIKSEMLEDEEFPDLLLRLEKDHCDVDMDSSKEETPSQQIHEEELPSQHSESGEQSHLERTNTVSDQHIKHEKDSQGHCDLRDMAGSSSEAMSYQGPVEEIPHDRSDGQLHLEGMNKVSDQVIKHEEDSQGHCDLRDMGGSSSETMPHRGPVEECPIHRSDGQLHLEGMNKVSDQPIKHERDSQGHCDFDVEGGSSEEMSYRGPVKEIPLERADQHIQHEKDSQDHRDFYMDGSSKETCHQGPVEGIPLDRSDGTNSTISDLNCDVLSQEGVFKDPCLDSYEKVQKTSRTDDGTNNSAQDCEVLGPSGVSADQYPADLDSDKNFEKTSVPDGSMKLKCSHCSKRYSCMNEYQKHLGTHACQKPHQSPKKSRRRMKKSCDSFTYRCASKQHLKTHVRVHTGERPYGCSLCGKRFLQSSNLKIHMRSHSGQKPYSCDICDYRCSQKGDVTKHMREHTGKKPHECSLCGKIFAKPSHLKIHMRTHSGEKPYSCDICDYRCSQKGDVTKHMRVHTGEKPYECSLCGKRFTRSSDRKIHMRIHSGEKPYSCDICDFRFSRKGHLTRHMRVHNREKAHECSLCGKRFTQSSDLKIHMRIHSGEKPYSCDICGYRCSYNGNLAKHMRVHTGKKPHECSLCGKRFAKPSHLKIHMRIHSGEKPYSCDICDYRCSDRSNLTLHMRVHTGEKPHECSLCDKSFRQSGVLKRHMMIHTGQKPYSCDICDSRFSRKEHLSRHMRVHTGQNT